MNNYMIIINQALPAIIKSLGAGIAVYAASIMLGSKKRLPFYNAFVGTTSCFIKNIFLLFDSGIFISTLIACIFLAFAAQIGARFFKHPVTLITIPTLYPLVPGSSLYMAVHAFLSQDKEQAGQMAIQTITIALAIALALLFVETVFSLISKRKKAS